MNKPKILLWDIETSHVVVATFSLFPKFIPAENILQDWFMICAAWKWYDKDKVYSASVLDDKQRFSADHTDDYHVIKTLHKVLSEADAIVHHNGDRFDIKKFNARAVFHGFKPLQKLIQIDTLKIARKEFAFTSNKLDALGEFFGVGRKVPTTNKLWLDCLDGNRAAIREMVGYNKVDVTLLQDIYDIIAPYTPAKLNMNHFYGDGCPACGSSSIKKNGHDYDYTRASKFQRYRCKDCGHPFRDGQSTKIEGGPILR